MIYMLETVRTVIDSFFFFFQAEDGIRDYKVTGVQTCALPICREPGPRRPGGGRGQLGRVRFGIAGQLGGTGRGQRERARPQRVEGGAEIDGQGRAASVLAHRPGAPAASASAAAASSAAAPPARRTAARTSAGPGGGRAPPPTSGPRV